MHSVEAKMGAGKFGEIKQEYKTKISIQVFAFSKKLRVYP